MKTCISISILTVSLLSISPHYARVTDAEQTQSPPATSDGQHDFDFAVGTWNTRVRRLLKPLSGPNDWVEGTGTVSTRKVWGGRAQLEELTMDTGDTHLKGLALRLYNPKTRQWRLHWANAKKGVLSDPPASGASKTGRGEFSYAEGLTGKPGFAGQSSSDIT